MSAYELRILNESTGQYIPLAFVQGADGKDTFAEAQAKGYTGTEDEFYSALANAQGALEELINWSGQHGSDSSIHTTAEEKAAWNGKAGKPTVQIITIPNSGWETSGPDEYTGAAYYCSVEVAGVVQDESKQVIYVAPGYANRQSYEAAGVRCIAQDVTSLMFAADSLPSGNLTVYVAVQEAAT